jgi:hypothetical protein
MAQNLFVKRITFGTANVKVTVVWKNSELSIFTPVKIKSILCLKRDGM